MPWACKNPSQENSRTSFCVYTFVSFFLKSIPSYCVSFRPPKSRSAPDYNYLVEERKCECRVHHKLDGTHFYAPREPALQLTVHRVGAYQTLVASKSVAVNSLPVRSSAFAIGVNGFTGLGGVVLPSGSSCLWPSLAGGPLFPFR